MGTTTSRTSTSSNVTRARHPSGSCGQSWLRQVEEEEAQVTTPPLLLGPHLTGLAHSHFPFSWFPVWVNSAEDWGLVHNFFPCWVALLVWSPANMARGEWWKSSGLCGDLPSVPEPHRPALSQVEPIRATSYSHGVLSPPLSRRWRGSKS